MKVVILTTEQGNQIALCNKLARHCELAAIVLSKNIPRRKKPLVERFRAVARRASVRLFGSAFINAWSQMQQHYLKLYPKLPDVPAIRVNNINDDATINLLRQQQPDLIVVSGTNLVNRKTMESAPAGSRFINLHTGISPFVKGGPNCSNWCLAEKTFHLIGNTVMWLDLGIDSGNIITTEQTRLDGRESLFELHWKVMEHAHDLYCRVVDMLGKGQQLPSVSQDSIGKGRTFYGAEWNGLAARRALKNFQQHYGEFFRSGASGEVQLISLEARQTVEA
jgi:methionyl-tRNA formyltransferase